MKPSQRKPPAKRLFNGIAGSPLSGGAPTEEPRVPAPDPPKVGRPPKGDRPMTDAERKREQRRNEAIADVLAIPDSQGVCTTNAAAKLTVDLECPKWSGSWPRKTVMKTVGVWDPRAQAQRRWSKTQPPTN